MINNTANKRVQVKSWRTGILKQPHQQKNEEIKGEHLSEPNHEIEIEEIKIQQKIETEKRKWTDKEGFTHPKKVIKIVDKNTNPSWSGTNIYNNLENKEIDTENSQYENGNMTNKINLSKYITCPDLTLSPFHN